MKKDKEVRYDVVIIENKTNKIVSIAGRNMAEDRADKREMTALSRIDRDNYHVSVLQHIESRKVQK